MVNGSNITLAPAQDFKPGERVFVTAPATVLSLGGVAAVPYVYQFTAQAGMGPGTFSGGSDPAVGNRSVDGAVADVNGDGYLDILAANYNAAAGPSPGTVSVRLNDGSGTFSGMQDVSVGSSPQNVVAADIDGDGDLDLLTTNTFGLSVSVRLNNGMGIFAAPATGAEVNLGYYPVSVATGDVDGDGDLDLLTANKYGASFNTNSTVSVRLNNGTGIFVGGQEVAVGLNTASVTVGDVDGDGDLDLLTANIDNNTVSVRLNQLAAPTITSFTPTSGVAGTSVTITDTNFTGATGVTFNGVAAPGFVVNSATQITASVPTGATSGPIAVATPSGTVTSSTSFTVPTAPMVAVTTTSLNPTSTTPFVVTVTFSQPVTGFTASSITVANGSVSSPLAVSGNAYSFTVTPVAAGAVTISVAANVAQNTAGIGNTAAAPLVITYQIINPSSVWTGATSTDWFTSTNWTNGVPTASQDAIINPSSFGRQPVIGAGAALSKDLVRAAGASLTMSGGTLDVRGDWTNNSTFTATGGTVIFGAAPVANLPGPNIYGSSGSRFWNLSVQANGLRISTPAGAAVQRVLTLTGNLSTLGNPLTLLSSPTGGDALVVNSGGVVTGAATVQRAIDLSVNAGLGYRHYNSPVSNATVADLATMASGGSFIPVVNPAFNTSFLATYASPFPTIFGYDQSRLTLANDLGSFDKGYFSPNTLSDQLVVGRGYTVNIAATELVDFQGTLNNGDLQLNLSRNSGSTAADAGWQLLGNPYPAPLDYSLVMPTDRQGLDENIYIFSSTSPYNGRYRAYTNGVGGNAMLPVGQGFFVRVAASQTSASLTFRNSQRLTVPNGTTFQRTAPDARPLVQLTLSSPAGDLADEVYVYFHAGATPGVDASYDGEKLPNPSGLNLSTVAAGTALAINGLPLLNGASLAVALTVQVPAPGTYTFHAAQLLNLTGIAVYLRDKQLNTLTDLHRQPTYSCSLNAASASARFELVFGLAQVLSTGAAQAAQVVVYPNPAHGQVTLELPAALSQRATTLTLVDALGRLVREQELPAGPATHTLLLADLAIGVYSLRLHTETGILVKKLVLE